MQGKRILLTGATGLFGLPIALDLAKQNEVIAVARFNDQAARAQLEAAGVQTIRCDVGTGSLDVLPRDMDYVFHAGAAMPAQAEADQAYAFAVNAEATGRLMSHCRSARAFVHCSTASAYRHKGPLQFREDDELGLHLHNYSLTKIAGERLAVFCAGEFNLPTTVLRIASLYGPLGGAVTARVENVVAGREVVLHPERPNNYNPMYETDYVALAIRSFDVASTTATVVNFCGSETMSAEDYCAHAARLVGTEAKIAYSETAYFPLWMDPTRMHEILGRTQVAPREGIRRVLEARHPDRLVHAPSPYPPST